MTGVKEREALCLMNAKHVCFYFILVVDDGDGEEDMDEIEVDATTDAISLSQLLNRHGNPEAEDYGDEYDDEIEDDY